MPDQFLQSLPLVMIAVGAGLLGSILALFWSPGHNVRGSIQHLAAGAVLAAVASDVIPEVERTGSPVGILGGLAAGGLAMIVLKWLVLKFEHSEEGKGQRGIGLAVAAAVDTLLDGTIVGAGFIVGQRVGGLLVAAFALELLFLTLSVGSELHKGKTNRWLAFAITTGVALLLLPGAFASTFVLQGATEGTVAIVLAFGAAALIYLVAEELLVETIQAEKNVFTTAMLFAGFLLLIALKLFGRETGQ